MPPRVFDVCVIGSGPGGGIAAYALTKAGASVALVEAGRRLTPGVDYNAHKPAFPQLASRLAQGFRSPVQRVTDFQERDHFTPVGDRPAHGLLKALGGRSLCWAGHSLRFGPLDFQRWPISYDEVAPWYARAERFMAVYGNKDGLSNLPDGEFQKPVPMRCPERLLHRGVKALQAQGRALAFIGIRKAMPTERHPSGRPVCHYCGHCMAGCEVDSKYTSANTPIPRALQTGRLSVFLESTMTRIVMAKDSGRVAGIEYVDAQGQTRELRCRFLVLSCSTIETARQLLLNNLANSSGQVGRNLTSHFGTTVAGVFPELYNRDASNDDGTDYYHSLLTGLYWDKPNSGFEGTYQIQCGGGLHPGRMFLRGIPGYGLEFKRNLKEWNAAHASMNMQGSLLISSRKFVDLDPARKDRFGHPVPRIHLHYEDSDVSMARDMVALSEQIIRAGGGRVVQSPGNIDASQLVIDSNHWVGAARMGRDPKTSVVNPFGQSHDVPNLFLGDASVFPAYPEKNPTLTNIALTWRMADHLASLVRKGDLA